MNVVCGLSSLLDTLNVIPTLMRNGSPEHAVNEESALMNLARFWLHNRGLITDDKDAYCIRDVRLSHKTADEIDRLATLGHLVVAFPIRDDRMKAVLRIWVLG